MHFPSRGLLLVAIACLLACDSAHGKLSTKFYAKTCPNLEGIVRDVVTNAVARERRLAASLLRLFFHDCFVNGCDASILLDDKPPTLKGEKNANPNKDSVRGYEVIDEIKSRVESTCKDTVSCADIVALASLEGVAAVGGPKWKLVLGRRDALTAREEDANNQLPSFMADLPGLLQNFSSKNLDARDLTALSGGHTLGFARCITFRDRIYNESNIDPGFANAQKASCPRNGDGSNLAPFDASPSGFDNQYFKDLVSKRGLLHSDQQLFNGGSLDGLVKKYSENSDAFFKDFSRAMTKMSKLGLLTGTNGEIRKNCRVVN